MALKIRLARGGSKKRPYYRMVVAEATAPRDGLFLEKVGTYNPLLPRDHADRVRLVEDRIKYWMSVGAKPTDRVARFLGEAKIIPMPAVRETPTKSAPKEKTQERLREKAEKIEATKTAAAEAKKAAEAPAPAPVEEVVLLEEASIEEAAPVEEVPVEEVAPAEEAPAEEAKAEEAAPAEEVAAEEEQKSE